LINLTDLSIHDVVASLLALLPRSSSVSPQASNKPWKQGRTKILTESTRLKYYEKVGKGDELSRKKETL
jgi:hypothetical protein